MFCCVFDGLVDAKGQVGGADAFLNFEVGCVVVAGADAKANVRIGPIAKCLPKVHGFY